MIARLLPIFLASWALAGCVASPSRSIALSDHALWNSASPDNVSVELRCRGLNPSEVRAALARRYAKREARIEAVLGKREFEDYIPTGRKCSYYRGATEQYERTLKDLESRLGQMRHQRR